MLQGTPFDPELHTHLQALAQALIQYTPSTSGRRKPDGTWTNAVRKLEPRPSESCRSFDEATEDDLWQQVYRARPVRRRDTPPPVHYHRHPPR